MPAVGETTPTWN